MDAKYNWEAALKLSTLMRNKSRIISSNLSKHYIKQRAVLPRYIFWPNFKNSLIILGMPVATTDNML
jgi:hypothetical protein